MAELQTRRIIVTGDFVVDYNFVQWPGPDASYSSARNCALMFRTFGGAAYLVHLISQVCSGLEVSIVSTPVRDYEKMNEAYQIWAPCNKEANTPSSREKVWRITKFLGCHKKPVPPSFYELRLKKQPGKDDIFVIDHLGLGFAENEKIWKPQLELCRKCGHIVLKASTLNTTSDFFHEVVEKIAAKTTLVVSAASLRAEGAAISEGLSWDRTIEDLLECFSCDGIFQKLTAFARVIVRFGLCGVGIFSRYSGDLQYRQKGNSFWPQAKLVRFIYDPNYQEDVFYSRFENQGIIFGAGSFLTTSIVRHIVEGINFPLFVACTRALLAGRKQLIAGGGPVSNNLDLNTFTSIAEEMLAKGKEKNTDTFRCSFPRMREEGTRQIYGFSYPSPTRKIMASSQILRDVVGGQAEAVAALATDIVLIGPERALSDVPKVKYGNFLSVDREEIERINAIRKTVLAYLANPGDTKPLSIAVFGPPGAGKSFAIKELFKEILGMQRKTMTFNLSQFRHIDELYAALHQVHDETIRSYKPPIVFFDEFDTDFGTPLGWLKYFLAPMHDGEFWDGLAVHPVGKSIFVFAGGKHKTFGEFESCKEPVRTDAKVPDFISRLRGYMNVKGPNSMSILDEELGIHRIRRAIMLRHEIETYHQKIIDPTTGYAAIGLDVIRSFLFAREFKHGARSISAIVSTSRLRHENRFTMGCLPSTDILLLHVSDDFIKPGNVTVTDPDLIESLSMFCHEFWRKEKEKIGYKWGPERNDDLQRGPLTHPLLMPYDELPEEEREERNRRPARLFLVKVEISGKHLICRKPGMPPKVFRVNETLKKVEHDFWVRQHLLAGWQYAQITNDHLKLHSALQPYVTMNNRYKRLDKAIVASIPRALKRSGYEIV